jgi:anti-sigma regulatory factor (Ser/Thr protein kinase)
VYLDVQRRELHFLNPTAKQLHHDGLPLLSADLQHGQLQHLDGRPVTAEELPLLVSWKTERTVEAIFVLVRPSALNLQVSWNTAPLWDLEDQLAGIVGSVICSFPEPDWQEMAGLAHDLRTPLNAIGLQIAVLDSDPPDQSAVRQVLQHLRSSAERALHVGMDLLEWCRGPASRGRRAQKAWFELEPFLAGLIQEQMPMAERKGLTLVAELSKVRGWEVATDRVRLGRLLSNLLVNAVRYTTRGRVEFTTSWRFSRETRLLTLSVVDTGVGIATEEQDSIFEPFAQGRAGRDSDSGGSGLGLAVVERLVSELGLDLEVYSEYGRGSAFNLILPAKILRGPG